MTTVRTTVGRYHVERLIAHGGMGSVYLARDPAIDRQVVIKLLKEGFDDAAARERFAREARSAGRLQHPNIVTVFDVGEHDDRPFIAMEYVRGETLAELIKRDRLLRISEKLAILEDVCAGLHYAHGVGIVHRDIKPANVMRLETGLVKVLDFGVARAGSGPITRAGDVVGTLNYMSPEQLLGEPVDHRTDVYSVGALGYELFTLRMAFPGTIDTGVLHRILNASALPITGLVPEIDPDVAAIVERAMARDVDARYQHLEEMREDVASARIRLIESGADVDQPIDQNAETRVDSARIASGPRLASRRSSTLGGVAPAAAAPSSSVPPPHRANSTVLLGVACAALAGALAATLILRQPPAGNPSVKAEPTPNAQASPPQSAAPDVPGAIPSRSPDRADAERDERLRTARDTASRQMAGGERQAAIDALVRGLALDATDPALNRLADDFARTASRTAADARTAASGRGANARSSVEFRGAQTQEREAQQLVRAGERVPGIRAFFAAAALYNNARGSSDQPTPVAPLPTPALPAANAPSPPSPDRPAGPPVSSTSPQAPIAGSSATPNTTASVPSPPVATPPPATATAEPPPIGRDDPRAAELSAIRETLRRYAAAYQSLNSTEVGRIMPSLNAGQLRDLQRDFSSYRRYAVEIRDERVEIEGAAATVTCQVVRAFQTKTGVDGSNTVSSIFHLRRTGAGWTIERLESR